MTIRRIRDRSPTSQLYPVYLYVSLSHQRNNNNKCGEDVRNHHTRLASFHIYMEPILDLFIFFQTHPKLVYICPKSISLREGTYKNRFIAIPTCSALMPASNMD